MTVRGGGIPRRPLALTPNGRMGPPLRSFAADAHDCIMVRVLGPTGYKVVARLNRAPKAGSPLIVIATALSVPSCSKPSRYGLARAKHAARLVRRPILTASARIDLSDARVGMKKRTLRSNQETDEGKRCAALANSLTKKAPYKGLWVDTQLVKAQRVAPVPREKDIFAPGTFRAREGAASAKTRRQRDPFYFSQV